MTCSPVVRTVGSLGRIVSVGLALLAGCNQPSHPAQSPQDRLVKSDIDLLNASAAEFEFLATKPSAADVEKSLARVAKINDDMKENRLALKKLPLADVKSATAKYQSELTQATQRCQAAGKSVAMTLKKVKSQN